MYVLKHQMVPYCLFFMLYLIYAFVLIPLDAKNIAKEDAGGEYPISLIIIDKLWVLLLCIFSAYFLKNEWRQVKVAKWDYLKQIWNYADVVPPILLILICMVDFFT